MNERSNGLSNKAVGFRLLLCVIAKDATKASLKYSITTLVTFLLVDVVKPL